MERKGRKAIPFLRHLLPLGLMPLLISSLPFALMHFRKAAEPPPVDKMFYIAVSTIVVNAITIVFALVVIHLRTGANAVDFGWQKGTLKKDFGIAAIAFLAIFLPIYLVHAFAYGVINRYDLSISPDPVPLFFLALVLGLLMYRTHRIMPSIFLHAFFNAGSLFLAWMTMK